MTLSKNVTCRHCERTYSRPEHLQRHLLSHSSRSPHQCHYCRKSFKRKDVLDRHVSTCSGRVTSSTPFHDRACQRCANKKRKCNHERPRCQACVKAGVTCRYPIYTCNSALGSDADPESANEPTSRRLDSQILVTHAEEIVEICLPYTEAAACHQLAIDDVPFVDCSPSMGASLQVYLPSALSSNKFPFLLRFTTQYSLKDSFNTAPSSHASSLEMNASIQLDPSDIHQKRTSSRSSSSAASSPTFTKSNNAGCLSEAVRNHSTILDVRAPEYIASHRIHAAIAPKFRQQGKAMNGRDSNLFTPNVLAHALDSYWSNWHPNWPVVHKPTFSIDGTPTPLLAAMIVLGSCYRNIENASDWFDAVEDLAFDELELISPSAPLYQKIQIIQAAYLACIFQTWDGGTDARTRVRRRRFGSVVTAVRDLDMSMFRHGDLAICLEDFDWIEFVRMEECIRTLLWVFQLDTAYIIFNNMPPNFALRELSMGLASPEMSFQASSRYECFNILRAWRAHNGRTFDPTLYGLIKTFFKQKLNGAVLDNLAHESFMNLWCVDAAFHVILFNLDPVLGGNQQFTSLERGINNWQAVWNQRMVNNDEKFFDAIVATEGFEEIHNGIKKPWQYPGFWKNAAEYWLLARVMLDRMIVAHESAIAADELSGCTALHVNVSPHIHDRVEDAEMRSLHSFLAVVGTTVATSIVSN